MVNYKPYVQKNLQGRYKAEIVNVESVRNNYYDEKNENSTKELLDITFQLDDGENDDSVMFTQRYIAPLTNGKSLFQQLLDLKGELPDKDGGEFDEQKFLGLKAVVTMGKNKKGYAVIELIEKDGDIEDVVAEPDPVPDFLNN